MNYDIGDKVSNKLNGREYTILSADLAKDEYKLEHKGIGVMWVYYVSRIELDLMYTKIPSPPKTPTLPKGNDQLDWFGYSGDWTKSEGDNTMKECTHNWKVYHGLNFSDEYCTKCNAKREWREP